MPNGNGIIDETWLMEDAKKAAYESRMESALQGSDVLSGMSEEIRQYVSRRDHDDSDGYEYVSVGEFAKRVAKSVYEFMGDHVLFFSIVAFIGVATVIMAFGRLNSFIMIFMAFILLALLAAILLYLRWQDWKDKREELAKAEMLYNAAQEAKRRHGVGDKQEDKKEASGEAQAETA